LRRTQVRCTATTSLFVCVRQRRVAGMMTMNPGDPAPMERKTRWETTPLVLSIPRAGSGYFALAMWMTPSWYCKARSSASPRKRAGTTVRSQRIRATTPIATALPSICA